MSRARAADGGRTRRTRLVAALLFAALILSGGEAAAGDALETYADIAQYAIPSVAGAISLAKRDGAGFVQLGVGTGVTFGVTRALKYGINSERPNGGDHSFPSGHASGAFSGASYLHYRYGWKWGLPAYVAASVVCTSIPQRAPRA